MKNILKATGTVLLLSSVLTACVNGKGEVISQTHTPGTFSKIDQGIKGDVELVKDENIFVEVLAQQNIHDIIDIKTEDETLKIRTKSGKSIGKYEELKFFVHAPVIDNIRLSGSGNVTGGNGIIGEQLRIRVVNQGNIDLSGLDVSYLEVIIAGAGSVTLKGLSAKSDFGVGSNGRIEAYDLRSTETGAQLKGNGYIKTWTSNKLEVFLSGSGGIYYKGTPEIKSTITGNGVLLKVD